MSKFVSNGISKSMLNLKKLDNWQTEVMQVNCSNTVSFKISENHSIPANVV